LIREHGEKVGAHALMVADGRLARITQNGGLHDVRTDRGT
jgi:hypothetical protein